MRFAPILAVAVLTSTASTQATAASEAGKDCRLQQLASFDMITSDNHILVPVTIGDKSARMILNIASAVSVLRQEVVTAMKLRTNLLPFGANVHFGNSAVVRTAHLDAFAVGGLRYRGGADLPVVQFAGPVSGEASPIVGALGMDVFTSVDLELDFIHRKIALYAQDHCPGQIVYWSSGYSVAPMRRSPLGNVYFPMQLNGKYIDASLSTEAPITSLTTDVTRMLYGFDEHSRDVET